ncbi:MAG TPA: hypothetical protein PK992_06385 [Planctomycetaceae bacterium]|nr:hypothetical protein [Planctomycetaceae bacterium]
MTLRYWIPAGMAALIAIGGTTLVSVTHAADEKAKGGAAEKTDKKEEKKPEETVAVEIGGLKLKLPKSWKQSDATLPMRLATFEIPAAEGDKENGELVVSSFPGGGGGVDANLGRWIGQFDAEGREADILQGKAGKNEYFIVNISGTYQKSIGPPVLGKKKPEPGSRMVGVILNVDGGAVYFLKMTGPDATVAAQVDALRASFGGKSDGEEAYEF